MEKAQTIETSISVVVCPRCGAEHEILFGKKPLCSACNYNLGEPEKLNWIEKKVEGVICDRCGRIVVCTPFNFIMGSKFEIVACPECRDENCQHFIAIFYHGGWMLPKSFFHSRGKGGILDVRGQRDEITLEVLNASAKGERPEFRKVGGEMIAKILWVDGEAVGYYTYTPKFRGAPCMHQIYVLPKHRRKGYGQLMTDDFMNSFDGEVSFEIPMSQEYTNLLEKIGLLKREDEKLVSTGRIRFISGGL